ncbi:MAG: C1 family peptidase [Treponema sp.]|jgi:hypothetical protein|nr:C1 family peptidase [Treponema sp.]
MFIKKIVISSFFVFFLTITCVFGQGRGAIFDEQYENLPRRAELTARSYEGLPSSFSLRQYAPLPGDQANTGTCVAWAASYAARTITESVALNRVNQTETTQNAFSPTFVYRTVMPNDPRGMMGTQIYTALDMMRDVGTVRMLDIERTTSFTAIGLSYFKNLRYYPIGDYVTLFSREDRLKPAFITRIVKKSLTEGKPVIIGMNTPDSFTDATDVWEPRENPNRHYYGHALCVVGYDDNRYGGAFEVLNSWGRKWGNGGYIWIPYQVFINFVIEGYEIIENIANYSDTIRFEGFVRMEAAGQNTEFTITPEGYRTTETLNSGTEYRFFVGARESAYVYTFLVSQLSGDNRVYSPVLLFPQPRISPLMNYAESVITLPSENMTFTLNAQAGTEYLITLYSKQALDIQGIMRRFETASGSINKRLVAAIENLATELTYTENQAGFSITPDNPRVVAALVVAVEHQ